MAPAFRVQRVTLTAGTLFAVKPPQAGLHRVRIGASTADVLLHTAYDQTEYRTVIQNYERDIDISPRQFDPDTTAFWLLSNAGGLVLLEWV